MIDGIREGRPQGPALTYLSSECLDPYALAVLALILIACSLGLDNFAVSIAIGISGVDRHIRLRIALTFGLFEAGMPIIGLAGSWRPPGSDTCSCSPPRSASTT